MGKSCSFRMLLIMMNKMFLLMVLSAGLSISLSGMHGERDELHTKILANDFNGALAVIKRVNDLFSNQKLPLNDQERICNELFQGLVEEMVTKSDLDFNLICLVLEAAGYSVNEFLKGKKDNLPLFLLNIKLYKNLSQNVADILAGRGGDLDDSLGPLKTIEKAYQRITQQIANSFLAGQPNVNTLITDRYKKAAQEVFDVDVKESINKFCHNAFFAHFLDEALKVVYESKKAEFAKYLAILLKLLKESNVNSAEFLRDNVDISKIDLFKDYKEQIAEFCHQETNSNIDYFTKSIDIEVDRKLLDFSKLLNNALDSENFKNYSVDDPGYWESALEQIKKIVINFIFAPSFEKFNNLNCRATIYRILAKFGLEILSSDQSQISLLPAINIKKLLDLNDRAINAQLEKQVLNVIYEYIISERLSDLLPLLDRLNDKGFTVEFLIKQLAFSVAIFLELQSLRSISQAQQSGKEFVQKILKFFTDEVTKSKYKFGNYYNLVDRYIRTYILMTILQSKSKNETQIKDLLSQGVEINARNLNGQSLLNYGISHCDLTLVQLLIEKGADVNLVFGAWARTPLMNAVLVCPNSIVKFLVESGADLTIKDINGEDVLSLASGKEMMDFIKNIERSSVKGKIDIIAGLSLSLNSLALK